MKSQKVFRVRLSKWSSEYSLGSGVNIPCTDKGYIFVLAHSPLDIYAEFGTEQINEIRYLGPGYAVEPRGIN